jgi:predicted DNA-binding transcriptional regulator AlpA
MNNERTDPLRTITMAEVCRRTGFSRRDIYRRLADDEAHGTRGVEFAAPLGGRLQGRQLKWREVTVVKWLERLETVAR